MKKLYIPIALLLGVIFALTYSRETEETQQVTETTKAEPIDIADTHPPPEKSSSNSVELNAEKNNESVFEGIKSLSEEIFNTENFEEINAFEVSSSNSDVNIRGIKSALNRNGAIFIGNVKHLTTADEIRKPAVVWGVADIEVKNTLWGDVGSEISVPFAFDDFNRIKELMKKGKPAHPVGFVWNNFQQDRSSDYLFVIQEGHENRVLSKKDAAELGLTRWVHRMSKVENGDVAEVEKWGKVLEVYENNDLIEVGEAAGWLLSHTSNVEGFHRFALEALIMQVAPIDYNYVIKVLNRYIDTPNKENLVAVVLSNAKRGWEAKKHQYSMTDEEREKNIARMSLEE